MTKAPVMRWPLAGRGTELAAAQAAWDLKSCRGVLIYGAAGVGKTRLAEEFLARVAGHKTLQAGRATASAAAAGVPLGAIAHLIPPGVDLSDPVQGFVEVARALAGPDRKRRWALLLDDLHLLDATSAVLVRQLMDAGVARLIATVRTGEPVGDATATLLAGEAVHRIDLDPFTDDQVGDVLRAALGGPVTQQAVRQLAGMSAGNALYLREFVLGALAQTSLVFDGEIWQLVEGQAIAATSQLAQLIDARLEQVDKVDRAVLDLLALCEPVALADAEAVAGGLAALTDLEAAGLVRVTAERRRTTVALEHPLYGEALRENLPVLHRQSILQAQVERVRAHGARRRGDALRIAGWELAATGTADPDLLVRAAAVARYAHDYPQALSLLDALPDHAHTVSTRLMQGEAHYELGDWRQCESMLALADTAAGSEQDVLTVTMQRTENLFWAAGLEQEALKLNSAAHQRVHSEAAHRMLRHGEAAMEIARGRPHNGLALLQDMGDDVQQAPDVMTWLLAATLKGIGLEMVGRCSDAVAFSEAAYAAHLQVDDRSLFLHPAIQLLQVSWGLASSGQLSKARAVGEKAFAELTAARIPVPRTWMALYLGRLEWLSGHPATARRWFAESGAQGRSAHQSTIRPALEGLAACAAVLGDLDAAEHALEQVKDLPQFTGFIDLIHLAPAWTAAARGDLGAARTILAEGATVARGTGLVPIETVLLTDLARLGGAKQAAPRLADLAHVCDGAFAPARAQLAQALAADDPDQLNNSAQELQNLGADLLAAEAATAAATAYRTAGHARKATAATHLAQTCSARCEGAHTPLLATTATASTLTPRERDIALLAAHGTPSQDIADTLHLSVRTVENHLQHAYTKLGVTTRRALAHTLDKHA